MLSASADSPFSRFLPVAKPWGGPVSERPIRVFVAISNPSDLADRYNLPPADVELERKSLEVRVRHRGARQVSLGFPQRACDARSAGRSDAQGLSTLLHVLSHGAFSTTKQQAALFLQNQMAPPGTCSMMNWPACWRARACSPSSLSGRLPECDSLDGGCFLGAWPQAGLDWRAGRRGDAGCGDRRHVRASCSGVFYRQLLEHGSGGFGNERSPQYLLTARRPDAAVPVLFMRLKSGRLWAEEDLNDIGQPAQPKSGWNTFVIRDLLTAAFSDEELTTLCFDHFRPVYEDFAGGMSKGQKIQRLLDHCERQGQIDPLLVLVQKRNPARRAVQVIPQGLTIRSSLSRLEDSLSAVLLAFTL